MTYYKWHICFICHTFSLFIQKKAQRWLRWAVVFLGRMTLWDVEGGAVQVATENDVCESVVSDPVDSPADVVPLVVVQPDLDEVARILEIRCVSIDTEFFLMSSWYNEIVFLENKYEVITVSALHILRGKRVPLFVLEDEQLITARVLNHLIYTDA